MHTHLFEDNKTLTLRDNIDLHYFGNGCLVEYYATNILYLDPIETTIIENVNNGFITTDALLLNTKTSEDENIILNSIDALIKKGVLVYTGNQSGATSKKSFTGEYGKFYPKTITIELTNACNYRCSFCYRNACGTGTYISDELVDQVYNFAKNKVRNFLLTGGEPTLHPKATDYITKFASIGKVAMISNGSRFFEMDGNCLKKLSNIQFSLYGCSDSEYLEKTGNPHGFTNLKKSVKAAIDLGIDHNLALTLKKEELGRLEEYLETAISLGAKYILIECPEMFGRGDSAYASYAEYEDYVTILRARLLEQKRKLKSKIHIILNHIQVNWDNGSEEKGKQLFPNHLFCGCGSERLVISPLGNVRACEVFDENIFSIGNLDTLVEQACGNLHQDKLTQSIEHILHTTDKQYMDVLPCSALQDYYITHMRESHEQ